MFVNYWSNRKEVTNMTVKISLPNQFSGGVKKFTVELKPRCKENRFYDESVDVCYFSTE